MTPSALFIDNDLTLTLSGVRKADTGDYLDGDATVTYAIVDEATGDPITDGDFTYVALSSGNFRANVQSADLAGLVAGSRYTIAVTAAQDGYDGRWTLTLPARQRGRS